MWLHCVDFSLLFIRERALIYEDSSHFLPFEASFCMTLFLLKEIFMDEGNQKPVMVWRRFWSSLDNHICRCYLTPLRRWKTTDYRTPARDTGRRSEQDDLGWSIREKQVLFAWIYSELRIFALIVKFFLPWFLFNLLLFCLLSSFYFFRRLSFSFTTARLGTWDIYCHPLIMGLDRYWW